MAAPETSPGEELAAELRDLLTLVAFEPVSAYGRQIKGLPGVWSARTDGALGARVELAPSEHVLVDGVARSGVIDIDPVGPSEPSSHTVALDAEHRIFVRPFWDASEGVWVGLTWDSAPRMQTFRGISTYPTDERWRIPVLFTPAANHERVSTIQRFGRGYELCDMTRAGWFTANIGGERYQLSVDRVPGYSYVTFRDAGSGTESYSAGRVIYLPDNPAEVRVLDLNRASVLPCAFNPLMPCPLPSQSNIIRTIVRAGQRDVLFDETN